MGYSEKGTMFYRDVVGEHGRVVKAEAKAIMGPCDMPWGQRSSVVAEPDENMIEIGSFNEGAKDG